MGQVQEPVGLVDQDQTDREQPDRQPVEQPEHQGSNAHGRFLLVVVSPNRSSDDTPRCGRSKEIFDAGEGDPPSDARNRPASENGIISRGEYAFAAAARHSDQSLGKGFLIPTSKNE